MTTSLQISPQEAARELLRRREARRSYLAFLSYTSNLAPAAHHRLLIDKLQAIADGRSRRLMVFMPPGSAKSHYANVWFAPFMLGVKPESGLITASYGQELADKWGRRSRSIVASPSYQRLFGFGVDADSRAVNRWGTEGGGEYLAVGVGGPTTGNRADGGIIDDPVKGREEAESQRQRDRTWEWYRDDFWTRLKPNAWQVLIMTRWHEDDLGGRLLAEQEKGGERWDVLKLPAVAEEDDPLGRPIGEPLWPEWFTTEMFGEAKRDPRRWSALYQQRPSPEEGTFFQRPWLKSWDERPKHLAIYGTSDYAVTDGGGDFTVHRVWGVDPGGGLFRLDGWRGQTAADEWIERKLDLIAKHRPLAWFGEAGVIQKAIEPMLRRRMRERKVFCRLEWLPSIADKPTRARGFQARASMGEVWFEPGAEIDEFLQFPAGKHDDDVDVASLIGRALDEAHPAIVPSKKTERNPPDLWGRRPDAESWKVA